MAEGYLKRGWRVIATGRESSTERLRQLAKASHGALEVETVDITLPEQVAALRGRVDGRRLHVLFVNAGVKNDDREKIAVVSTDEIVTYMVTQALRHMKVSAAFT